ncbi:hypothetical protein NL676_030015 [Syzygium grande]|nr:hypothetical protein NL676_030015 [Syzygium grande]
MDPPLKDTGLNAKSKHGLVKNLLTAKAPAMDKSGKPEVSSHPTIRVEQETQQSVEASAEAGTSNALPKISISVNVGTSDANRRSSSLAVPTRSLAQEPQGRRSHSRGCSRGRSRPFPSQNSLNIAGTSINQHITLDSGSALKVDPPTSLPDIGKDDLSSSTSPSVSSDSNKSSDDSASEIDSESEKELASPTSFSSKRVECKDISETLEPVHRLPSPDCVGPPSDPVKDLVGVLDPVNQKCIPEASERVSGLPIPSTVSPSSVLV